LRQLSAVAEPHRHLWNIFLKNNTQNQYKNTRTFGAGLSLERLEPGRSRRSPEAAKLPVLLDAQSPSSHKGVLPAFSPRARAGRIDVLVNNAGVASFGPIAEQPLDELRRVLDTNVVGAIAAVQVEFA
jgi:NAD(P)-dependent dehydrogenase (short-subunit alcohol dehydrogenase family)